MIFFFLVPPFLLCLYAQWKVKSAFSEMSKVPSRISGAQAARRMLDTAGLQSVGIDVTDCHDLDLRVLHKLLQIMIAHATYANAADMRPIILVLRK